MFLRVWFLLLLVGFFALWASERIDGKKPTPLRVCFVIGISLLGTLVATSSVEG